MQSADRKLLQAACSKAEGAYGAAVRGALAQAVEALRTRPHRLEACMKALAMETVSKAQLWQKIRKLRL